MANETTFPETNDAARDASHLPRTVLALAVAWCRDEPWRAGEVLLVPPGPSGSLVRLGRGPSLPGQPSKATFGQLRLGQWLPSPPLITPGLSRYQLELEPLEGERLLVRNQGRCSLLRDGTRVDTCELGVGDLVQLGNQLLLLCVRRTTDALTEGDTLPTFPFGAADAHGLVGESEPMWELRRQLAMVAVRPGHVLITGPSGSGKELVAQAIHALSPRGSRRMVARNAATLPEALIDAELFGNAKNYPNPGMPDRPGLVGDADGSSLFLDEIAELPQTAQSHLLRVLDAGEYQRLGETSPRRSDFRVVAATNRNPLSIKHDLLARFTFQIAVPDLNARKEDIPLLVRYVLAESERTGERPPGFAPPGSPRADKDAPLWLIRELLQHRYETNVRELRVLLWQAMIRPAASEPAPTGAASADGSSPHRPALTDVRVEPRTGAPGRRSDPPSPEQVQRCLDENNGSMEQAFRALGLSSRFALLRLIKRYDIEVRRRPARSPR